MTHSSRQACAWLAAACSAVSLCTASLAGTINYGDFGPDFPPGVTIYTDVQESSGTDPDEPGLYGAPTLTGDTLDFDPAGFVASSTSGATDITDGQLNFGYSALEVNGQVAGGLTTLQITESGDFTLFGTGTAATSIAGAVSIDVDILEVDGKPISPISIFASNSMVRDLVSDGPVVLAPWDNGVIIEFGTVLAANNIDFEFGVTKAEIAIDDQLIAISEEGSVAFIAKKDFTLQPTIELNPNFEIPEPATVALLATMLVGAIGYRRLR
ncbi:PEP-CTERM sorting domain-containing protein [Aeoliella sp. ICT_H6.2]|uniref:PEP-CTERM sorting domain-containing protein n=1 Tax=Aeoliella straminimaris TaxID=2954799 RepID=A0A9X2FB26_9BACT|nr:PEP-CTERM sorting domain-containing protein [Aeoliella straminimaris]MCO6045264.1 PEP-CTERM sorting domain-containing protein [Aeoliella straminimaris]